MKHLGTKVLTSDRLVLRPLCVADAHAMFTNWANDSDVTKYLTWPAHPNEELTKTLLEDWETHYNEPTYYQWAITLKDKDEPIGTMGVVDMKEEAECVQLGYCIGQAWWNQGITSEALSMIITYLFDEVKAKRIEAKHDSNNPNSGKVMMKCGMVYEGTLRKADRNNQGIVDACMYAILASEYK